MNPTVTIELSEYNRLLEIEKNQALVRIENYTYRRVATFSGYEFVEEDELIKNFIKTIQVLRNEVAQLRDRNLWQRIWNIT